MKIAKRFLLIFVLLVTLEINMVRSRTMTWGEKNHPFIQQLKDKFDSFGSKMNESKFFNFALGASLKVISLMEGNPVIDIIKCVVSSIEVYYVGLKFPNKTLVEIQSEIKGTDEAKLKADLEAAEKLTETENISKEELEQSEKTAISSNCVVTSSIIDEPEALEFIDGESDDDNVLQSFLELRNAPISPKTKIKKLFKNLKTKIKDAFKKMKSKIDQAVEKIKEKLKAVDAIIRKWLSKPIVKSFIAFLECSIPHIASLAFMATKKLATLFSGIQLINLIKMGPKLIKMIIDSIKHIRVGYLKSDIKEKYMEFGKGTAGLIMVFVLGLAGADR